jgi:hypothetical protein
VVAPAELGGQHATSRAGDPSKLGRRPGRLTNMVTASATTTSKWSSGYVNDLMSASSTLTPSATPAAETFACARSHQRRDVRSDHLRLVLPREPARGRADAAADVQHLLAGPDGGELEQSVGRGPASGMNDPLAQGRQERVGVQRPHLLSGQRRHSSRLREIQENA